MRYNLILDTDSYKTSHYLQYPKGANAMFSYLEARSGEYPETVFFGLQMLMDKYLSSPISQQDIDEATTFYQKHGVPFDRAGWQYILDRYQGWLPITIRAVPEGRRIPNGIPLVSVQCNDPKVFHVASYVEDIIMRSWYPCTVATKSLEAKKIIRRYMEETCDDLSGLPFKLHDFGARGVSSYESAQIGGAAHLVNFMGSDTVVGIAAANHHYHSDMAAFSIPAAEHSTITSWGRENEAAAYANMVDQFGGEGKIYAVVSDSYNIFEACDRLWGQELRQRVIDKGGMLVIRPDSGDPVDVTLRCIGLLASRFGYTTNSKGFMVLKHCRLIYGDGMDLLACTVMRYPFGAELENLLHLGSHSFPDRLSRQ